MKDIDQATIRECKISSLILMENAGHSLHKALCEIKLLKEDTRILILVGSGNNGGDGLVLARLLARDGFAVDVFYLRESHKESEDMRINKSMLSY